MNISIKSKHMQINKVKRLTVARAEFVFAVIHVKFGPVPAVLPQKSFPLPSLPRVFLNILSRSRGNPAETRGFVPVTAPVQFSSSTTDSGSNSRSRFIDFLAVFR